MTNWLLTPVLWIWNTALAWPVDALRRSAIYDAPEGWPTMLLKTGVVFAVLLTVAEIYVRIRDWRRRRNLREMRITGKILHAEDAYTKPDNVFGDQLDAVKNPDQTLRTLKARKDYPRLGEVYAGLNQPGEAAKWFAKAGDHARAGAEYAKAGQTKRAADALAKAGDHVTAARFYAEVGAWKQAASSYSELGALAEAAYALFRAGKYDASADTFNQYFSNTTDGVQAQVKATELCLNLLRDARATQRINPQTVNALRIACAQRLYGTPQRKLAMQLYELAGARPPKG